MLTIFYLSNSEIIQVIDLLVGFNVFFETGIPGVKTSLLEEFGVRLITYDLPGFGESDPHARRNLKSSAFDILYLADAVGVDKFWVLGFSSGSIHAWAALRYIPDRIAGIASFFFIKFIILFYSLLDTFHDKKYVILKLEALGDGIPYNL